MAAWFQRRFDAIIELDGSAMPASKQIEAEVCGWTLSQARRRALALARMYAEQYASRGQPLSQFQLVHFQEQQYSWRGPIRLLLLIALTALALWLGSEGFIQE